MVTKYMVVRLPNTYEQADKLSGFNLPNNAITFDPVVVEHHGVNEKWLCHIVNGLSYNEYGKMLSYLHSVPSQLVCNSYLINEDKDGNLVTVGTFTSVLLKEPQPTLDLDLVKDTFTRLIANTKDDFVIFTDCSVSEPKQSYRHPFMVRQSVDNLDVIRALGHDALWIGLHPTGIWLYDNKADGLIEKLKQPSFKYPEALDITAHLEALSYTLSISAFYVYYDLFRQVPLSLFKEIFSLKYCIEFADLLELRKNGASKEELYQYIKSNSLPIGDKYNEQL